MAHGTGGAYSAGRLVVSERSGLERGGQGGTAAEVDAEADVTLGLGLQRGERVGDSLESEVLVLGLDGGGVVRVADRTMVVGRTGSVAMEDSTGRSGS